MNFVEMTNGIIGMEKPLLLKVFEEENCEVIDSHDEVLNMKEKEEVEEGGNRWSEGDMCLAKWAEDGVWYRAKISSLFPDEREMENIKGPAFTAVVCFVDYGNEDYVLGQNMVNSLEEVPLEDLVDETVLLEIETSGNADEDHGKVERLFNPPLHQQRHMLVAELLAEAGVTSVIDLGCNNCKLLRLLKGLLPSVTYLAGLDIDKEILEECGKMLRPLPGDWLVRRQLPLTIDLVHGSCGQVELALAFLETASISQVDAVTSVELIEHLDPDTLATFPATVLGALQPKVWLVTTPNSDFNELFPNFNGPFRHWDHRFGYVVSFLPVHQLDVDPCTAFILNSGLSGAEQSSRNGRNRCWQIFQTTQWPLMGLGTGRPKGKVMALPVRLLFSPGKRTFCLKRKLISCILKHNKTGILDVGITLLKNGWW